ncbi:MAG TPA: FecR domain-containing protein, partial [Puia sp.]|nr:FecR domain-containing protein [Puia sp.]
KLAPDEEPLFQLWLVQDPANRLQFEKLQQLWKEGLADYVYYRKANEDTAWEVLRQRIGGGRVVDAFPQKRSLVTGRWMAAAILMLVVASGLWYFSRQNAPLVYATAGEQKKMFLPDGSQLIIEPQSRIRVTNDYNKTDRTIILDSGKAQFEVAHQAQLAFTVDVEVASIKDIGTTFTVQKTKEQILVTVSSGKVAFIQKATGESREVAAGNSLVFYPAQNRFGEIQPTGGGAESLRFHDTPLSGVVAALQQVYGKRISIADSTIGQKRLTADLNGVPFADALKIVGTSLNLDYTEESGEILFKSKDSPAHTP